MLRFTLIYILLCASPLPLLAKRSGGGGGFNRGSSGARQQGPGSFQSGGNSFQGSQGGFNTHNGFNNGGFNSGMRPAGGVNTGGFRSPQPNWNSGFQNRGFSSGTGIGSASRGSSLKTALIGGALGAAGGILLYEGTKAIIQHASSPFHYNNRDYYWGDQYYRGNNNQIMCSIPFEQLQTPTVTAPAPPVVSSDNSTNISGNLSTTTPSPADVDSKFNNIQFPNGTRPKQLVWSCRRGFESCCGVDCCPIPQSNVQSSQTQGGVSTTTAIILGYLYLMH